MRARSWLTIAVVAGVLFVPDPGLAQEGLAPSSKKNADVELPEIEIEGTLERPEIFFVLPQARDRTDEQVIRARLKREITRPVVKHWLEETLLLE